MAKGRKCPYCNQVMFAEEEREFEAGSEVIYVCRDARCGHKEKFWEDK